MSVESHSAFARRIGVSRQRVSQMVASGLPVDGQRRVKVAPALDWVERHVDPDRSAINRANALQVPAADGASSPGGPSLADAKRIKELIAVRMGRLKLEREEGRLLDRDTVRRWVVERAAQERDSLLAWVSRVAPRLAAELGVDDRAMTAALDREVRDFLRFLAGATGDDLGE